MITTMNAPTSPFSCVPVILCGGSGTRLWPVSRELYPKQFAQMRSRTLFDETIVRCKPLTSESGIIAVCNEDHRFYTAAAIHKAHVDGKILLEPAGRNTAPAIALAAFCVMDLARKDSSLRVVGDGAISTVMLVQPSDHSIEPAEKFIERVKAALPLAHEGYLCAFGIKPSHAATGYGYILPGENINGGEAYKISSFREKPDSQTAEQYIRSGNCFWNSGIFLMRADIYLDELKKHAPMIYDSIYYAWCGRANDLDFIRPDREQFCSCLPDSIDYAVMERTDRAAVIPMNVVWNDLGTWQSLYEAAIKDENGNAVSGDIMTDNVRNCYIYSSKSLIAAIGVSNLVIIETGDAVLVADRDRAQGVKGIVQRLKAENRPEFKTPQKVYRPWGSYECLAEGDRFQVKRIIVNPGEELSLQKHHHRAEHWVIVHGTAEVSINGDKRIVTENESSYIPLGAEHRLKNPGILPLILIEIQSGAYLGEDDITRLEDAYGRN